MNRRKALVTGVAGFLGSNLLKRLLEQDFDVVGLDNLSMGTMANIRWAMDDSRFTFVEADAMEATVFNSLPAGIDVAVHLAAFKIPRYGNALDTLKINQQCTENVLDFCRARDIKCVIASTSDAYGKNPAVPFSEEHTDSIIGSSKSPRWGYAVSKLYDEHLALAYQDAYGFPVTLLRFFGSYGPNQPLSWWGGPPPVFIEAILAGKVIPIHGDGQQTRSFTYVTDTVDGIHAAMVRDEANGEVLNVGTTEEITILELAHRVHDACHKVAETTGVKPGELNIEMVPYESFSSKKYEDVRRRVPDTSLSERLLGVKAEVPLALGLERTVTWQVGAMKDRDAGKR